MAPLTDRDADADTLPVGAGVHLERLLDHEIDGEGKLQGGRRKKAWRKKAWEGKVRVPMVTRQD